MNNNNIDKNGTLALTFDLIPRPFLYSVMYSISQSCLSTLQLVERGRRKICRGGGGWGLWEGIDGSGGGKQHTCTYCVDSAAQGANAEAPSALGYAEESH